MKLEGSRILIVGCGDIGIPLAQGLIAEGATVWGLRRQPAALPAGIHPLQGDVTQPDGLDCLDGMHWDYVITTLTPAAISAEGYQKVFEAGIARLIEKLDRQEKKPRRILHVSSTSVYHQSEGQWVDEDSPTAPQSFSGKSLLRAEQLLAAFAAEHRGLNVSVIRFAGIYGPGRRRLIDQVLAGQGCAREPVLYSNRIHRDDCVGFLHHLLVSDASDKLLADCYIGVDSEPVSLWEVKHWLAEQLGISLDDTATTSSKMRRNSKRCSNRRLLATGYPLQYPSFRQGYAELLDALG